MALTVPVAEIVEKSKNPLLGKHESWGRVLLGEIATIQNGFPFKSSQFTRSEGMPLIRIRNVGADHSDTNYVGDYDPAFVVKAGDLLIGMDGDFNCARWRGPDSLLNQRVCRVILKSDIYHPKLLDYALPGYLKAINDMTSSVTVKHLSSKSIAEIPLPLPPMDQQKRIVAEIEKQFSRLDEAVANLKRVKANLKRYKAAVLKAAVEGRLVETEAELARREGRSYETGAQLLQRILEIRRSQWKGKGKYKEPAAPDTTNLPELPEGWAWATVEQLNPVNRPCAYGVLQPGDDLSEGVLFVRVGDINDGRIDTTGLKVIAPTIAEAYPRTKLAGGEVLITLVGAIGRTAVVPFSLAGANVARAVGVLTIAESIDPHWVEIWFRNPEKIAEMTAKSHEVARKTLNLEDVRYATVAIPPFVEQLQIVAEVERRLSITDEADAQVNVNLQRAERLRQSILSRAFSGKPHQVTSAVSVMEMHTHG